MHEVVTIVRRFFGNGGWSSEPSLVCHSSQLEAYTAHMLAEPNAILSNFSKNMKSKNKVWNDYTFYVYLI